MYYVYRLKTGVEFVDCDVNPADKLTCSAPSEFVFLMLLSKKFLLVSHVGCSVICTFLSKFEISLNRSDSTSLRRTSLFPKYRKSLVLFLYEQSKNVFKKSEDFG